MSTDVSDTSFNRTSETLWTTSSSTSLTPPISKIFQATNDITISTTPKTPELPRLTNDIAIIIGVLGAVAVLVLFALLLRIIMPWLRSKKKKKEKILQKQAQEEERRRHMGVYSIPPQSEISSRPSPVRHSYAVDSSVYPWDNSANLDGNRNYSKSEHGRSDHVDGYRRTNQTKNTYYQSENKYASLPQSSYSTMPNGNVPKSPKHPVARANSSASNFIQMREKEKDRRYNRDPQSPNSRNNSKMVNVLSTSSLEPLRMGDIYRDNWDMQFDPYRTSVESRSLSFITHPSENRMDLSPARYNRVVRGAGPREGWRK